MSQPTSPNIGENEHCLNNQLAMVSLFKMPFLGIVANHLDPFGGFSSYRGTPKYYLLTFLVVTVGAPRPADTHVSLADEHAFGWLWVKSVGGPPASQNRRKSWLTTAPRSHNHGWLISLITNKTISRS